MHKPICSFEGCEKEIRSVGLCEAHYRQSLKGRGLRPLGRGSVTLGMSDGERLDFHTQKSDGCWFWVGRVSRDGYGRIDISGRSHLSHRVAYEVNNGPIPAGAQIDHICHNRACVNPEHLRAVTNKQNGENRKGAVVGSRSSYRGVTWHKASGQWRAQVGHNYKRIHIGYFKDEEDAALAAEQKRLELFTHSDER